MTPTAMVFDIKRYAIYDGPGIRSTVFFKGCNLACAWCQNPESIHPAPDIAFDAAKCIGCGRCTVGCTALAAGEGVRLREACTWCFDCVENCPTRARRRVGLRYTPQQLYDTVAKDKPFFDRSGGGVSCSGGEAMLQVDFLHAFLGLCKAGGLHTVVDTAGNVPFAYFEQLLGLCDLFLYDLKLMEPGRHKQYTGADNARILDNAKRLAEAGANMIVRVPLIPGVTDTPGNLEAIAAFAAQWLPDKPVQLLPYNRLAETKYAAAPAFDREAQRSYKLPGLREQPREVLLHLLKPFKQHKLTATVINQNTE